MQRQFTSGSRQAPDPFDQFLEEHQFYRKHTARDASCLFRVISEQMYDTQMHHLAIREKCVMYMRKHRKYFDYHVDRDFDEYLDDMSKPKTYGTLLELQAASYMFERNVFLFQPFNLGNYFNEYRSNFVEVFRVFYTPERHFDSVFTSEYIQEAAICQSICYEILYKDLFKLPDVTFAVEQMLHGPTFENMDYRTETNEEGYSTRLHLSDGRSFELDLPHNTSCILENYKLCHFHYINFPRYSDDLQRELKSANYEEYEKNALIIQRTAESFLPNKYVSCVRQLLQEGITPFPYKVAKALDPNMYRNIEFDSWNEMRKELKLQNWYNGDTNFKLVRYSTRRVRKIFQVGAKCHVKLRKSQQDLYTCHIQEIAVDKGQCIVFVEQLGEKRLVPYENLTPLPPDQFKPWTVPYRLQRHMQKYSSVRFTRQYNYRFKFNTTTEHHHHHEFAYGSAIDKESCENSFVDDDPKKLVCQQQNQHCSASASYFKLKQYTHLKDFRTHVEYCTMPLTVAHSSREIEVSKSSGNQPRVVTDSSENSRTPSRSSASGIHRGSSIEGGVQSNKMPPNSSLNNVEENLVAPQAFALSHMEGYDVEHYNPNGAFYMPEMHGFYPMYPCSTVTGIPDDYYGYCGFEGVLPPSAAFMPPVNNINGIYYLCNNTLAPPPSYVNCSNPYFVPPPPPPPLQPLGAAQPSPMLTSSNSSNTSYLSQAQFTSTANISQPNQSLAPLPNLQPSANNTPQRLHQRSVTTAPANTPLSGRINYDAKKSVKTNGVDLPGDIATLRFFYNMGLDYYHKQKSNATEEETNDERDKLCSNMQNIKLDDNANQISSSMKSDNNLVATKTDVNESNLTSNQMNKFSNANANLNVPVSGNKNNNNPRRYSSRYFSGKDRQMPQRTNTNQISQTAASQQHAQQQYHSAYNNNNTSKFSNNYSVNNLQNTARATQQQQQQHTNQLLYLQPQQHPPYLSHPSAQEPMRQISPNCEIRANSVESRNSHTPTTANNSNAGVCANNSERSNDAIISGAINGSHMSVPIPSTTGGIYIPIPMAAGAPPTPTYGIFAAPTTTSGMGIHQNYIAGAPPQIITHCEIPTPQHHNAVSSGSGSDNMENACSSEGVVNNGALVTLPPASMQLQCPNYPPPMPFYFSANGVTSLGSGGSLPASATGVHLVAPFTHQVAPPATPSNQTVFASTHSSGGTQGYYCLQPPPPPILPSQQQVNQQLMQQTTTISSNKTAISNTLPHDVKNGLRNDLVQSND